MAFSDGLQTIGVFGNTAVGIGWAKCSMMSKICELHAPLLVVGLVLLDDPTNSMSSSSSETVVLWIGLRVSKHMIPSKQSSNPSLLSALAACTLSAFVKIYFEQKNKRSNRGQIRLCTILLTLTYCFHFGYKITYKFPIGQAQQQVPQNWVWF